MILEFEKTEYREMILQGRWGELAAAMDRQLKRGLLAMSAQVMDYENLQQETLRSAQEMLTQVLDPEGGSLGFRYEYTEEAWKKLEQDWNVLTGRAQAGNDGHCQISEEEERFLHAMAVCHIPLHLLAVIPEAVPEPLPFSAGLVWVYAEGEAREALAVPGCRGILCSDHGVEAHFRITSEGRRGEHPAAGAYTAYDAEGYVTGYTAPQERPLTVELYDAYPEDVMVRFTSMPADEYEYRRHWADYFSWQEHSEGMVRSELDRELGRVSAAMQAEGGQGMPGGYVHPVRDERSYDDGGSGYGNNGYGYGQSRPGSFGYDGGGAGAYGGYGGNGAGGYGNGYGGNGVGGYGNGYGGNGGFGRY